MKTAHRVVASLFVLAVIASIVQLSVVSAHISHYKDIPYVTYICSYVFEVVRLCSTLHTDTMITMCNKTNIVYAYYIVMFHSYLILFVCCDAYEKYKYIIKHRNDTATDIKPKFRYLNNMGFVVFMDVFIYIALSVMIGVESTPYLIMSALVLFCIGISLDSILHQLTDSVPIHSMEIKTETVPKKDIMLNGIGEFSITENGDNDEEDDGDDIIVDRNMNGTENGHEHNSTSFNNIYLPEVAKLNFRSGFSALLISVIVVFIITVYLNIKYTVPENIVGHNMTFTMYITHIALYGVIIVYLAIYEGIIRNYKNKKYTKTYILYIIEVAYIISTTVSIIILVS